MSKYRITWSRPNGEWGLRGNVDLAKLPAPVYAALCKLKDLEDLGDEIAETRAEEIKCDLLRELLEKL